MMDERRKRGEGVFVGVVTLVEDSEELRKLLAI